MLISQTDVTKAEVGFDIMQLEQIASCEDENALSASVGRIKIDSAEHDSDDDADTSESDDQSTESGDESTENSDESTESEDKNTQGDDENTGIANEVRNKSSYIEESEDKLVQSNCDKLKSDMCIKCVRTNMGPDDEDTLIFDKERGNEQIEDRCNKTSNPTHITEIHDECENLTYVNDLLKNTALK